MTGVHAYRIATTWRVRATAEEVAPIFADAESWARWWPAAFLQVTPLSCDGEEPTVRIHSKGWLPYTLRLDARVTNCSYPESCTFLVRGDFTGRCDCRIVERDDEVEIAFDWRVEVRKPLLRWLSFVARPFLIANHKWVMRQGHRSLTIELDRRRGVAIASPPQPSFPYGGAGGRLAAAWRRCEEPFGRRAERRLDLTPW